VELVEAATLNPGRLVNDLNANGYCRPLHKEREVAIAVSLPVVAGVRSVLGLYHVLVGERKKGKVNRLQETTLHMLLHNLFFVTQTKPPKRVRVDDGIHFFV
jgi:hypothetical protein